jgi:hypothetical protein
MLSSTRVIILFADSMWISTMRLPGVAVKRAGTFLLQWTLSRSRNLINVVLLFCCLVALSLLF